MLSKPHNITIMNIDLLMKKYLPYIAVLLMGLTFPLAGQAQLFEESKSYFQVSYDTLSLNLPDVTLTLPTAATGEDAPEVTDSGKEYLDTKATGYTFTYGRRFSEKVALDVMYSVFSTERKTNENTIDANDTDANGQGQQVKWANDEPLIVKGKYSYTSYGVGYRFYFPLRNNEYTTKWFFRPSFSFWSSSATFGYYDGLTKNTAETTQDNDGTVLDLQFGIQARLNRRFDSGWTIHHNKNNSGASVMLITKF